MIKINKDKKFILLIIIYCIIQLLILNFISGLLQIILVSIIGLYLIYIAKKISLSKE